MDISEIEEKLVAAKSRLYRAIDAMAPVHKGGEVEEFQAARVEVHSLERQLAEAKGEEYADTIEFPVQWDTGAPCPLLFCSDNRCFLAYYLPDPHWEQIDLVSDDATPIEEAVALVEFHGCVSAKLGAPNDEVFHGHPLYGRGLQGYSAQMVVNSRWLAELEAINSVHDGYRPERWKNLKHYIFWFHDSTFECVAESFNVEVYQESMAQLCARVCERLLN